MRIRIPLAALALVLVLSLPSFASTVRRSASPSRHHHRRSVRHHSIRHSVRHSSVRHRRTHAATHRAALDTDTPTRATKVPTLERVRFVPALRGSRASLLRQNEKTIAEGFVRIRDEKQLNDLRAEHELVLVPASAALLVNPRLPYNRRYCRPATAEFLTDLARVHYARFHGPLQVNSAVRTVIVQRELIGVNGNAAAVSGELASPHLTGAAVDIAKKGLSVSEIAWMRAWLLPLQQAGKIDVEEEFYQACFHITVYSTYATPVEPGPRHHAGATLLATGVQ